MNKDIAARAVALACLIVVITACPASAQLGRLGGAVKKGVREAAGLGGGGQAEAASQTGTTAGPRFGDYVLEMTPDVLDRVESVAQAVVESGPRPGPMVSSDRRVEAKRRALEASRFNDHQFGILKERIIPFCRQHAADGEGSARIPGSGRNIHYVYAPGEIEALAPRCGVLLPLLEDM